MVKEVIHEYFWSWWPGKRGMVDELISPLFFSVDDDFKTISIQKVLARLLSVACL